MHAPGSEASFAECPPLLPPTEVEVSAVKYLAHEDLEVVDLGEPGGDASEREASAARLG